MKLKNKEFLKFETYQIYNVDLDEMHDGIILDVSPNEIFVLDTKHGDIILFNLDGELLDFYHENLRLLHVDVKPSIFTSYKYEAQTIGKYHLVKLRNNQIAIITEVNDQFYCFGGYIISPSRMVSTTWTIEGFAYANIESDYDIKEVLSKRTITYQ